MRVVEPSDCSLAATQARNEVIEAEKLPLPVLETSCVTAGPGTALRRDCNLDHAVAPPTEQFICFHDILQREMVRQ